MIFSFWHYLILLPLFKWDLSYVRIMQANWETGEKFGIFREWFHVRILNFLQFLYMFLGAVWCFYFISSNYFVESSFTGNLAYFFGLDEGSFLTSICSNIRTPKRKKNLKNVVIFQGNCSSDIPNVSIKKISVNAFFYWKCQRIVLFINDVPSI